MNSVSLKRVEFNLPVSFAMPTLWCLIEGGWNSRGGWKNPQNLISGGVGINGGL